MALVPSGKCRIMVAQRIDNPLVSTGMDDLSVPEVNPSEQPIDQLDQPVATENITNQPSELDTDPLKEKSEKVHKPNGLSEHVISILEHMGYERRRLQDFSGKMVHEKLMPDGTRDVEITIPAKFFTDKYTTTDITSEQLQKIVKELTTKHKLYFGGADIGDKKIVMKFTSIDPNQQVGEDASFDDGLDEVYGKTPGKEGSKMPVAKKSASTIQEMIKTDKDGIVSLLLGILQNKGN